MADKIKDVKKRIISFLTKGDIVLNSEEEKILSRWEYADHLMRCGTPYADMILKLTGKFSTSKFTADNDITSAQEIFGKSRTLNKSYLCHLHLEEIDQDLARVRKMLFPVTTSKDEQVYISAKEIQALAKLHEAKTRLLAMIPQEPNKSDLPNPKIIYELVGVKELDPGMTVSQALRLADKLLNHQPIEDIDYETLPPNEPGE